MYLIAEDKEFTFESSGSVPKKLQRDFLEIVANVPNDLPLTISHHLMNNRGFYRLSVFPLLPFIHTTLSILLLQPRNNLKLYHVLSSFASKSFLQLTT